MVGEARRRVSTCPGGRHANPGPSARFERWRNYMPETPDRRSGTATACRRCVSGATVRHVTRAILRQRCASSAPARSAARWRAGWPPPASPPWWWTAPPCRRWSTRRSTAAPTPSPPARAACWRRPACGTALAGSGLPDPRHPRQRRPPRPPGLAAVPALRPPRGRRRRRPFG